MPQPRAPLCCKQGLLAVSLCIAVAISSLSASDGPCASQHGFSVPLCEDAAHLNRLQYHYTPGNRVWHDAGRQEPTLALDVQLVDQVPDFSFVVSVHNHEAVVAHNVGRIIDNAAGIWELVVVFDGCSDGSVAAVVDLLRARTSTLLEGNCKSTNGSLQRVATRMRLVDQPTPVWETSSDNIGVRQRRRTAVVLAHVFLLPRPGRPECGSPQECGQRRSAELPASQVLRADPS